jgi:nucleoside phosphorylase
MTVLILTPLPLEYHAVIKHITGERETIFKDQAAYEVGKFRGKHHAYTIVVREPGMKNVDMALATEKAIRTFKPQIAFLIGVAGGVKDVKIGDLLIAQKAYGYESGKEDADGYKSRPAVESFSGELLARAQALSRLDEWKKRTADGAPEAKVFIGPIAAGDKVVAGTNNPTFQRLKTHYNDTLGLEMEAIGFATAAQAHRDVHALIIRGISDLCAGKAETDKHNWQPIAAERAAGFGFELLWQLNASSFIQTDTMEVNDLVKGIYALLFPAALKEIRNDFSDASNNEIRQVWQKVKPLFIEEVEALAKDPDEPDAQADVRNRLKKELAGREGLQRELVELLAEPKKLGEKGGVVVKDSKNVMANSNITVGGDFRLGDG